MMAPSSRPVPSSRNNPCGVCGRTKDGDCRLLENGTWLCHNHFSLPGATTIGSDGRTYAYTAETSDGRAGIFTIDKPQGSDRRRHLRAIPSGVSVVAVPSRQQEPAPPSPADFSLAAFLPEQMLEAASWRDGDFWHYDENHRQQRKGTGKQKRIYAHTKNADGTWLKEGSSDCPCWNEALVDTSEGTPLVVEGERVADALCQAGLLGLSMPGHLATNVDHCTAALLRLKAKGLDCVAYLADNDDQGRKKAAVMAKAAMAAGLPFVGLNAGAIWPDLPAGGSVDDLGHLEPDELASALDQAFRDELEKLLPNGGAADALPLVGEASAAPPAVSAGSVLALDEATNEKQAALARLVDQLVEADAAGNTVRKAALMSQTWRLGVPSATTEALVLERWAELRGITTETATAPVAGRTIGEAENTEGLQQRLPGFLLENGLHLLIADAGTGKTLMALEMARLLANGGSGFLDHQEPVAAAGRVLYIGTDGGSTAFSMISDYATGLADPDQWSNVEFWCEEAGKRTPWSLTLHNLELLVQRLNRGDIKAVIVDTINAVFQSAGLSPYLGPVDTFLRLLKAIVCPHGPLIMLGHTNRNGSGIKGIGGAPAFQEVPDALHTITRLKQPAEDGTYIYRWTVEKLRGESFRQFCYSRIDDEFKVVEGHYFTNCADKVLAAIKARKATGEPTWPKYLAGDTKEAPASVRSALTRLKQRGLIEKKGKGFTITPQGEQRLKEISL